MGQRPTLAAHAPTGRHWIERWAARARPDVVVANSRHTLRVVRALFPDTKSAVVRCTPPPAVEQGDARSRLRGR